MKKMKFRLLALLALPLLVLTLAVGAGEAGAAGAGRIVLDNRELPLPKDVQLENVNGSVMVPIRVITEGLGFKVDWEQQTRNVTVSKSGKSIKLAVGSTTAEVDGQSLALNAAPKQQASGTVLVPIRFVSQQFGLDVGWDNADKTVYLAAKPDQGDADLPETPDAGGETTGQPAPDNGSAVTPVPSPDPNVATIHQALFQDNKLTIALNRAVQPRTMTLEGPYRIVADLPGAVFDPSFPGAVPGTYGASGTLDVSAYPHVSQIRYSLFGDTGSARFVIELNGSSGYAVVTDEAAGTMTIDLNAEGVPADTDVSAGQPGPNQPYARPDGKPPIVVLDAGHGGSDPGAISTVTKQNEKTFNLAVVLKTAALLEAEPGIEVVLTRSGDTYPSLEDRVQTAQKANADLFISVHANSLDLKKNPAWSAVNGTETYYTRAESRPFAEIMHKHVLKGTGLQDRGLREKNLYVTRKTTMPAVLLESGYLTNEGDVKALFTEELQNRLAAEIVAAIKEYLGMP